MRRHALGATLLAVAAAAALCGGLARADGDPASDTLVFTNAFLPSRAPSKANAGALRAEIADVYAAGYRIKVAVIGARYDLGAIPSLFGKPTTYARFLGSELTQLYIGPLLVVMPGGYGIYDGGRSTAAESAVLATVPKPSSPGSDDLTTAATTAVGDLLKHGALRSKDILPPYVQLVQASAKGTAVTLRYYVDDDSGKAAPTLELLRGVHPLLTKSEPMGPASPNKPQERTVIAPGGTALRGVRACVAATDPSGNTGRSCLPLVVRR